MKDSTILIGLGLLWLTGRNGTAPAAGTPGATVETDSGGFDSAPTEIGDGNSDGIPAGDIGSGDVSPGAGEGDGLPEDDDEWSWPDGLPEDVIVDDYGHGLPTMTVDGVTYYQIRPRTVNHYTPEGAPVEDIDLWKIVGDPSGKLYTLALGGAYFIAA